MSGRTFRLALAGFALMVMVPAAQAAPSSSGRGVLFGMVDARLVGASPVQAAQILAQDATTGVTAERVQLSWTSVEPTRGTFDWAPFDQIVNAVVARHMQLLVLVDFTPQWARVAGCRSYQCRPADPKQFAAFTKAAATRYGSRVRAWEIWNEPNSDRFWMPRPSPAAYSTLLQDATAAIRSVSPGAYIVSGGMAPESNNGKDINELTFMSKVCSAGGLKGVNAVGVHPYSAPAMPNYPAPWNAWQQMAFTATNLRGILEHCGAGSDPLWITEYGAATNGPGAVATVTSPNLLAHPNHVSEQTQAAMISQAVSDVKSYTWVGAFFVYSATDYGASAITSENFFGLRHQDGTPKPAWGAFRAAITS